MNKYASRYTSTRSLCNLSDFLKSVWVFKDQIQMEFSNWTCDYNFLINCNKNNFFRNFSIILFNKCDDISSLVSKISYLLPLITIKKLLKYGITYVLSVETLKLKPTAVSLNLNRIICNSFARWTYHQQILNDLKTFYLKVPPTVLVTFTIKFIYLINNTLVLHLS